MVLFQKLSRVVGVIITSLHHDSF